MAAALTDKFMEAAAGGAPTTLTNGKQIGDTSLTVASTTGMPSATAFVVAVRVVDSSGNEVSGTYTEFIAIVAGGTTLTINPSPVYGTDQVYTAGSTTQVYIPVSSYAYNNLITTLLLQHNQDGTHGAVTANSLTVGGTPFTDFPSQFANFLTSGGGIWTAGTGLVASSTAGYVYYRGTRYAIPAVSSYTFTASQDTYIDVNYSTGAYTYVPVANGSAEPSVTTSCARVAKVVTGASAITSIDQNLYNKPVVSSTLADSAVTNSKLSTIDGELGGAWETWTPTVTFNSGSGATSTASGRYMRIGKTIVYACTITVSVVGTAVGPIFTLPVTANSLAKIGIGTGREDATSGNMCFVKFSDVNHGSIGRYDNGNILSGGNGSTIQIFGSYEAA